MVDNASDAPSSAREAALILYSENPVLAHRTFFGHYHADDDAPFHAEVIEAWHSKTPSVLTMAFRGSSKSTLAEESIALIAALGEAKNILILKESETRAADSLKTIRHYFEYDDQLQSAFDVGPGEIWTETRITLTNGVIIQAYGRGQSLRGVKHLNARPDLIFLDDVEDKESGSVATPEARAKTKGWLAGTVIPALAPGGRMRMAATPLHPDALAPTLARADRSWSTKTYPLLRRSPEGTWASSWPSRFPLAAILAMRRAFDEIGESETFAQEYMCQAVDPATRVFSPDMIRVSPQPRLPFHPVYCAYDPARTTHLKSATTGMVAASWVSSRLIVWEAQARKWMPDEIVADVFRVAREYSPVAIGVEETGLNEWLLQPLRARALELGEILPLRPLRAPRGKLDFIRALQPLFASGSIVFARDLPELKEQLLGFPNGAIDAPNALAYLLVMKLGVPVYDGFAPGAESPGGAIDPDLKAKRSVLAYLAVATDNRVTAAALLQMQSGRLAVLWDKIADGDAGSCLEDLVKEASLNAGEASVKLLGPPSQFDDYGTYGLRAAARALAYELQKGGSPDQGREEIRRLFRRSVHGRSAVAVSPVATWTLRALGGGFARLPGESRPMTNAYAVLMEAIESFAALTARATVAEANVAYTQDGRRYLSALAR